MTTYLDEYRYNTMVCPNCESLDYTIDDTDLDMTNLIITGDCTCADCGTTWEFIVPVTINNDNIADASIEYATDERAERMNEWTHSR